MAKLIKKHSHSKNKYLLGLLLFSLLFWNIMIRLAIFIRILGSRSEKVENVISKGLEIARDDIIMSSVIISFFALLSWFIMNFVYPKLARKFKIRRLMIGVVLFDIFVFISIAILLGLIHYSIDRDFSLYETIPKLKEFIFNSTTLFFLIVLIVGSYIFQLIHTLFHQLGHAKLGKVIVGYYQRPREENRIFMFLDLQSSTSFAEKLGHKKYSYFIQDCFKFLTNSLLQTNGRVYQFVGDEVVITWDSKKIANFCRSVDFFFLFEEELKKQKTHFLKKYGLAPVFTASINEGKVMAAEVGQIKRELAFHGDVLNTAARIQKQCKPYKKQILVTHDFGSKLLKTESGYSVKYVDTVKFFGKGKAIKLYEICT